MALARHIGRARVPLTIGALYRWSVLGRFQSILFVEVLS